MTAARSPGRQPRRSGPSRRRRRSPSPATTRERRRRSRSASPASHATLTASAVRSAVPAGASIIAAPDTRSRATDRPAEVPCARDAGRSGVTKPATRARECGPRQRVRAVGGGERPEDPGDQCRSHVVLLSLRRKVCLESVERTDGRISWSPESTGTPQLLSKFCRVLSVDPRDQPGVLRIGELSRRVGVSDHVLRAWETRYGLLTPGRSAGRLPALLRRRRTPGPPHAVPPRPGVVGGGGGAHGDRRGARRSRRRSASRSTGPTRRRAATSSHVRCSARSTTSTKARRRPCSTGCLSDFTLATTLRDVVVPYLHQLGERWERR